MVNFVTIYTPEFNKKYALNRYKCQYLKFGDKTFNFKFCKNPCLKTVTFDINAIIDGVDGITLSS